MLAVCVCVSVCVTVQLTAVLVSSPESISIVPGDARWVGAWWLGYLIAGFITLLSAIPFWFLPKSLPIPVGKQLDKRSPEHANSIKEQKYQVDEPASCLEMTKGKSLGLGYLIKSQLKVVSSSCFCLLL